MGTEISLRVSGIELISSKNSLGIDHGALFQDTDHVMIPQHERFGLEETAAIDAETRLQWTVLRKPLAEVADRLELLGFSIEVIRLEYENIVRHEVQQRQMMVEYYPEQYEPVGPLHSFGEFFDFITHYSLNDFSNEDLKIDYPRRDEADGILRKILPESSLKKIPRYDPLEDIAWSEKSAFIGLIDFLHPYSVIRLLSENRNNGDEFVEWDYGEIVANGWVHISEINPGAGREESFLIATEGKSDIHVLTKAFKLLKPGVADFFRFIDVTDGHPFSGTGGLSKFAEGLVKIDVQNRIVFVLDNDSEGVEGFNKITAMKLPHNMGCMCLPDLPEFERFPAKGPDGLTMANINGQAAAIECYLDLNYGQYQNHYVRWTNFKKEIGTYQGALEHKEYYAKRFLDTPENKLHDNNYDYSKLEILLNSVIKTCAKVSAKVRHELIKTHYPNLRDEE